MLEHIETAATYLRYLRSQYWSEGRIKNHQSRQLQQILRSARVIPFYRSLPDVPDPLSDLRELPILKRVQVEELKSSVDSMYPTHRHFPSKASGGSTGVPREFLFSRAHQVTRNAARMRYLRTHGWSPAVPGAWIIYLPAEGPDNALIRSWLRGRSRFFSVLLELEEQLSWLLSVNPVFLYTLPSTLDALLDALKASGRKLDRLELVLCGGEVVEDRLREKALEVTGVPIRDNYGSCESFMAWQCPQGRYHVNAEHVLLEILDEEDRPAKPDRWGGWS